MMDLVSLFLLLLMGILVWKFIYSFSRSKLPPGPKPWPLIGNLPELIIGARGGKADQLLRKLSAKYGPVMTLDVGLGKVRILIFDVNLMRQAFLEKARITSSRPYDYHLVNEVTQKKGILFNRNWEGPKKFVSNAVNGSILGTNLLEKMVQDGALKLRLEFQKKEGKSFDPYYLVNLCIMNMIASLLFSKTCNYHEPYYEEMVKNVILLQEEFYSASNQYIALFKIS